jgi:indole-3-glycerol phosphate synthase
LDRIIEAKRKEVARRQDEVALDVMQDRAGQAEPARDFLAAIRSVPPRGIHLIAEIKKASPSAGVIREDFDPVAIAGIYHEAGASALSVLTDRSWFQGELAYIEQVRQVVPLPVLRKDFTIDMYQVYESRAAGADAVLLIAEALATDDIVSMAGQAEALGMTALVEAHNPNLLLAVYSALHQAGLQRYLLGINNRDLARQVIDLSTTVRIAGLLSDTSRLVAESGIKTRSDVLRVQAAGAAAMLIGEALMSTDDIAGKAAELLPPEPSP